METLTRIYISMTNLAVRAKDEDGATAVEYALIVSLIAIAIILAVTFLGETLAQTFSDITNEL